MAPLAASGPEPSGSKEQQAAPGLTCGPNFSLLSNKCIHSACLGPKSLVITGFKWGPLRRNMRAAHLFQAGLVPLPVSKSPRGKPGPAFAGSSWSDQAEMALTRTFPYPLFCFTLPLPKQSCVLCHATRVLCLNWDGLRHLLAVSCPAQSHRDKQLPLSFCAWLAHSQVVSGNPGISYPQNFRLLPPSLFLLVLWGEGRCQGAVPAAWGPQGEVG